MQRYGMLISLIDHRKEILTSAAALFGIPLLVGEFLLANEDFAKTFWFSLRRILWLWSPKIAIPDSHSG